MSSAPERRERFARVAATVYEPLQRYLRRRAQAADAADALADTLLTVWRRLDDVPADPLPWCYGVARRCLANQRRGDSRRLRLVEHAGAHVDASSALALDPQQAKIVEMRYFGGLTVEEAAEALDISPATVRRHWTLARAFLKKELTAV